MTDYVNFSIGELARHLGMSPQGLHWYETKGLISPDRINSYRSYTVEDFCLLSRIRFYHQIGFGIEEIEEMIPMDLDSIADRLHNHVAHRRAELLKEQAKLEIIEEREQLTRDIEIRLGCYEVSELEPFYFKRSVNGDSDDGQEGAPVKKWVEEVPIAQYASIFNFDAEEDPVHVGIMLPERYLPYADSLVQDDVASGVVPLYPQRKVLYGFFEGTSEGDTLVYNELMERYDRNIFEGSIIRRPITCRRVKGETYAYWEVWAPLKDGYSVD